MAAMLLFATVPLAAQGSCNVNFQANCAVGGTATYGLNVTISAVVRVAIENSAIALPAPTPAQFDAGFGGVVALPGSVRANRSWTLSISAGSAVWSATPVSARQNKPATDLQWATAVGGPFANLTTAPVTAFVGGATADAAGALYFRVRYSWTADTPGSYTLPIVVTLTAP